MQFLPKKKISTLKSKQKINMIGIEESFSKPCIDNTAQEIFKESVEDEISQKSDALSPRRKNISVLTDNLVLTSAISVYPNIVESEHITCIINATAELGLPGHLRRQVIYHRIQIKDMPSEKITPHLDEAVDLIEKVANDGGRTLVFCAAGVSRSVTICLSYLMKYKKMTLLKAYNYVKERRKIIKPNCGFFQELIDYEKKLYKKNTVKMVYNECVNMMIPSVYDAEYRYAQKITNRKHHCNSDIDRSDRLRCHAI